MVAANGDRVCMLHFDTDERGATKEIAAWYPGVEVKAGKDPGGAISVLRRYFKGALDSLDEIEVEMHGTPFQQRVWDALRAVRAGTTASYSGLAATIGAPAAVRAVGAANGANPVAVIVPCHRVIGANGSLTGYGGGLPIKKALLALERGERTLL